MKKSRAKIPCACDRRNSAHPGPSRRGAGSIPAFLRIPDRGRRHGDAQSRELAVDPPVAPGLVPGRAAALRPHRAVRGWPPGPATPRQVPPPAADDVAMPAHDSARSDEQPHPGQPPGRHRPGEQRQPRPVRPRQPGARLRPLTPGDSELVAQHQDPGVLPPRLPARQPEQRYDTGHDQEDQLQAHKPKIIPPPAGPGPARPTPSRLTKPPAIPRASAQVAQVFGTHKLIACSAALTWPGNSVLRFG